MDLLLYLVTAVIRCLIYAMDLCLLIRALMSWFPEVSDGTFGDFIYAITEPLVGFVRSIIFKIRPLREFPLDLSLFFSCIFLSILLMFL